MTDPHPDPGLADPATVALSGRLAAGVDAVRPLLAAMGANDLVVLQVPPGTSPEQAALLYRVLALSLGPGASFTVVDPGRRLHSLHLPLPPGLPTLQTTDLRDAHPGP